MYSSSFKQRLIDRLVADAIDSCRDEDSGMMLDNLLREGFKGFNNQTLQELVTEHEERFDAKLVSHPKYSSIVWLGLPDLIRGEYSYWEWVETCISVLGEEDNGQVDS